MNQKKYRAMLCALALTTGFVYGADVAAAEISVPQIEAQVAQPSAEGKASETNEMQSNVAAEEAAQVPEMAAPVDAQQAARAAELEAKRAAQSAAMQAIVGKTVVSVDVAGTAMTNREEILSAVRMQAGDALTEEALQQDQRAIYELGYFFDVYAHFEQVPEGVKVVYSVLENPVLKDIVVTGNTKLDATAIENMLTVKRGEILNTKTLNADVRNIEQQYRSEGYIFTKVSDVAMSDAGVLTLMVSEGVLEGFAVKGNDKTKDYVITREMRLEPGEPFNVKDARRSMQRVYNLGFFDDVNMKLNPGEDANGVVLETSVVERRTGTFSVGAGYSDADGLMGIIEVGDTNFRGIGDAVKIHWEFGGDADTYDNYEFSYTRPWLDKKQTSASFRVYDRTHEYDHYNTSGHLVETYDKNYKGYELSFGRPQSEFSTNFITFKDRTDKYVEHVSGTDQPAEKPGWLEDNFGKTRSVTLAHVTDTRDNVYNPTEGARVSLSGEFSGFMGGDFDYNKYIFEDRHYFKVGRAHVIATRATVGYANGSMPEAALFDAGGQNSLRGYEDDQFRGNKMVLGTVEYRFPIASKVSGAVFTDFGNAWSEGKNIPTIHKSVGLGVQLETPIGPIRLDYGRGEDGGKTHFSFGGSF